MTRYQLAKLVQWAGTLRTRKRLQKTVYLMQQAGATFGDEFCLHRYGPYSHDLADVTDEMVAVGLLEEDGDSSGYTYRLSENVAELLAQFEETAPGKESAEALGRFEARFKELNGTDPRVLELAATISYHLAHGKNLPEAVAATCRHKSEIPESANMQKATELAERIR